MPYIKKEDRDRIEPLVDVLAERIAKDSDAFGEQMCGRLNYAITKLLHLCLEYDNVRESYSSYNELIGMLECAKLELYRRRISPYEDNKIDENGDV